MARKPAAGGGSFVSPLAATGAETQAFLRLLRWAEAVGRVERVEDRVAGRGILLAASPMTAPWTASASSS